MATKEKDIIGVGRRKTAIAAVRLRPGTGNINVNGRKLEEYFTTPEQRETFLAPINKLELLGSYDLIIRCKGGGVGGQVIAARLGLARALVKKDEELRAEFKAAGYLTRDPRKRERKKYGLAGARKRFQFSKR